MCSVTWLVDCQFVTAWLRQWVTNIRFMYRAVPSTVVRRPRKLEGCIFCTECTWQGNGFELIPAVTRRPASANRTARRQFQATGQPVSRTQASDATTSRLPRYEAKCVQRRCFQCESVPLRSDIKVTELPPANILIPLERQLIALQLCCWHWQFLYNETLQQLSRPLLSKLVWKTTNLGIWSPFWGS